MKVLVTGSSGFIGGHVLEALRWWWVSGTSCVTKVLGVSQRASRYPWDVRLPEPRTPFRQWDEAYECVNCDLTLEGQAATLMLRYAPDVVLHFAGDPLVKNWGPSSGRANYMATHHLLAHARPGCRFVLASSATVYGAARPGQWFNEGDPLRPTSAYAAAKAGAEALVAAHTSAGKVCGLSVRLAATVGGGATHGVVPDVLRKLRSDSPTLELLGDAPGSVKPFTHVSDVASGVVLLAFGNATGAVNLALPDQLSSLGVAEAVMRTVHVRKPVTWAGAAANWVGDNSAVQVDSSRAAALGWAPRYATSAAAVAQAARDLSAPRTLAA